MQLGSPKFVMFGILLTLSGCQDTSGANARTDAIEKAVSSHPNKGEGDYWLEVKGVEGNWIKVGLIFGFLGNRETCDRIAEDLATPPGYPFLQREYRCNRII